MSEPKQSEIVQTADGSGSNQQERQASNLSSTTRVILLAICLALGNVIFSLSTNSMLVVLDSMADSLHITENNLQWVSNSLQLPFGCFILVAGKGADIYGRKTVFLVGESVMLISTLIAGFMRNEIAFYIFRATAGLAGALVTASNFGLLAEITVPGRLRSLSMGIMFAGQCLGGVLGFSISGPLVESAGWSSVFYLVAGLYLIPLVGVAFLARQPSQEVKKKVDKRIDWLGATLLTGGFVLLFLSLSQSSHEKRGWRTPYIIAMLVTGFVVLCVAIAWESYLERKTLFPPILRPSILSKNNGRVAVVICVTYLCVCGYAGLIWTANIFYQRFEDMKPSKLMWRFIPARIVGAACNIVVGLVASRIAGKYLVFAGACGTALANVLFAIMNEKISATVASIYIANVVDIEEVAVAGATLQFGIMLANVCAPSFSTLIYSQLVIAKNGALLTQQESRKNQTLLKSLRATFWFWAAMSFTAAFLTAAFLRSLRKVGRKAPESSGDTDEADLRQEVRNSGELEIRAEDASPHDRKAPCRQRNEQDGEIGVHSAAPSERETRPDSPSLPKI